VRSIVIRRLLKFATVTVGAVFALSSMISMQAGANAPAVDTGHISVYAVAHSSSDGSISGVVTNSTGAPVPGLCIKAYNSSGGGGNTTTGADGSYAIVIVTPGSYTVDFDCSGTPGVVPPGLGSTVSVTAGQTTTLNKTLLVTGSISGVVKDSNGAPVAGLCVTAIASTTTTGQITTGADGSYTIANLAPGSYTMDWDCNQLPSVAYPGPGPTVSVASGQTTTVNKTLLVAGYITGVVTDSNGAPVPGLCVKAGSSSGGSTTTTGADGSYKIGGLAQGTYIMGWDCNNLPGVIDPGATTNVTVTEGQATTVNMILAQLTASPPIIATVPVAYGAPITVITSTTDATTATLISGAATATITVPPGSLPASTVVSVYPITDTSTLNSQVPPGQSYVMSLAVSWQAPDGSSPAATTPITMTITDPNIVAGDTIYELTSKGLVAVGTATTNGSVTVTFTSDPVFIVAQKGSHVVSSRPATITTQFTGRSAALSSKIKSALTALSKKLHAGALVMVTGYAKGSAALAKNRAAAVAKFLATLVKVHVTLKIVTVTTFNKVTVATTKN
jgi:hypothetical protein